MIFTILSALFIIYGCEKNSTGPEEATGSGLSDTEMEYIVAAELAEENGGLMADIGMATSTAQAGKPGTLLKTTSFDTTFTNSWISYSIQLSFFTATGREQSSYVENLTDKIIYTGSLAGEYKTVVGFQNINLNKSSTLTVAGITTDVLNIDGASINNSSYEFKGIRNTLNVEVESSYTVQDLKIDQNAATYLPLDGQVECIFKGTYERDGVVTDKSIEYSFKVTVEFSGGNQVKVTLPSRHKFTLDLVTGDTSE